MPSGARIPLRAAHLIGRTSSAASGLPWVADFRDPMARRLFRPIRASGAASEDRGIACATLPFLRFRRAGRRAPVPRAHRGRGGRHLEVIENGYDEESFRAL